MTITETKHYCDICGKQVADINIHKFTLPFITNCDWTEGRPCQEYVEFEKAEICDECLLLSTNLHCGFQGQNKILNCPPVDAKPMVHGHWIEDSTYSLPKCSICGKRLHSAAWGDENNFCGNCGADMREREQDDTQA